MDAGIPEQGALTPEEEFLSKLLADMRGAGAAPEAGTEFALEVTKAVRYLCGALPAAEADAVVRQCAERAAARRRLGEIDAELQEVKDLSWGAAVSLASGEGLRSQTASAWIALCRERVPAVSRAAGESRLLTWAERRRRAREGLQDAMAAAAAFGAFARQFAHQLRSPAWAYERGFYDSSQGSLEDELGQPGIAVEEARITSEGAFHARLTARPQPEEGAWPDGLTVYVDLTDGNTFWTLGAATFSGGSAEIVVEDVGEMTGLPAGLLPEETVRVRMHEGEPGPAPPSPARPWSIPAAVMGADGRTEPATYAVEVVAPPQWTNGRFEAEVRLPAPLRISFPHGELLLDVPVSDAQYVNIGAWRVADWEESPRKISAPCPTAEDVELSDSSCLQARIRRRAEG